MSTLWHEAMIKASGFYLMRPLTVQLLQGDKDEYNMFLLVNAWDYFNGDTANDLDSHIVELAETFIEVGLRLRGSEVTGSVDA
jgi:hypothetical protein